MASTICRRLVYTLLMVYTMCKRFVSCLTAVRTLPSGIWSGDHGHPRSMASGLGRQPPVYRDGVWEGPGVCSASSSWRSTHLEPKRLEELSPLTLATTCGGKE